MNLNKREEFEASRAFAFPTGTDLRLDGSERRALTYLLAVLVQGERIAMEGARLQATIAPTDESRKFLRNQARHELFHAYVFETAGRWISEGAHCPIIIPPELLYWRSRVRDAVRLDDFATSVLVQQVYLEGLGHILLQRMDRELQRRFNCLAGVRRLILSQEDEHHRFGIEMIEQVRQSGPEIAHRWLPVSSELFEQAHALLSKLREPFGILEADFDDYEVALRAMIPAWLREIH